MDKKLLSQALIKFFSGLILLGLLLFLPAGTWDYWQAWLLVGVLFVPMFLAGLVMLFKAPELLRRRLNMREEQAEQKKVIALSGGMFIAAFLLAGFGRRFGWPVLPKWVSLLAAALFLFGYCLFAEVLRENAYLSRTVEVQEGQELVSRRGAPPDVYEHAPALSRDAADPRVAAVVFRHAAVPADHRKAHPERGGGAGGGAARLPGI